MIRKNMKNKIANKQQFDFCLFKSLDHLFFFEWNLKRFTQLTQISPQKIYSINTNFILIYRSKCGHLEYRKTNLRLSINRTNKKSNPKHILNLPKLSQPTNSFVSSTIPTIKNFILYILWSQQLYVNPDIWTNLIIDKAYRKILIW